MTAPLLAKATLTYTAACPGCGRDVTWAAFIGEAPDAPTRLTVRCMRCEIAGPVRKAQQVVTRAVAA